MYYSRSFKCLVKSTFSVWLSSANNQKLERIFGHRHYTKKTLFVRINIDISSVLKNAGRRLFPYVKYLWCFKLHIICLLLLWLNFTCCSVEPRHFLSAGGLHNSCKQHTSKFIASIYARSHYHQSQLFCNKLQAFHLNR